MASLEGLSFLAKYGTKIDEFQNFEILAKQQVCSENHKPKSYLSRKKKNHILQKDPLYNTCKEEGEKINKKNKEKANKKK